MSLRSRMRDRFGLRTASLPVYKLAEGFSLHFRTLSDQDVLWAVSEARRMSSGLEDFNVNRFMAFLSVFAIEEEGKDRVYVWEEFCSEEIKALGDRYVPDKPTDDLRKTAAKRLYEFMTTELSTHVVTQICAFVEANIAVIGRQEIASYSCGVCGEVFVLPTRDGDLFCQSCGGIEKGEDGRIVAVKPLIRGTVLQTGTPFLSPSQTQP